MACNYEACQSLFDVEFDVLFEDKSEGKVIVEVLDKVVKNGN